jgi:hypothetical protein
LLAKQRKCQGDYMTVTIRLSEEELTELRSAKLQGAAEVCLGIRHRRPSSFIHLHPRINFIHSFSLLQNVSTSPHTARPDKPQAPPLVPAPQHPSLLLGSQTALQTSPNRHSNSRCNRSSNPGPHRRSSSQIVPQNTDALMGHGYL